MKQFLIVAILLTAYSVQADDLTPASRAVNRFALDLHKRLSKPGENFCFSPYSIQNALAMTYAGANGSTKSEMSHVLHYPNDDDEINLHRSFKALNEDLDDIVRKTEAEVEDARKYNMEGGEPVVIKLANRLFGKNDYHFNRAFLELVEEYYHATLEHMDFGDAAAAAAHINKQVEEITNHRISDLLSPSHFNEATRLILVNALYLKAPWREGFKEHFTELRSFHLNARETVEVPTMMRQDTFGYEKHDSYTAVSIPYRGGELQFLILLPDAVDGLVALEKSLALKEVESAAKLSGRKVILKLPKFSLSPESIELKKEFIEMGMRSAFDEPSGSANFESMAARTAEEYLFISEVVHKTMFSIDEKGTEAAAATAVVMMAGTAAPREVEKPVEVHVDRPFLFAVQHRQSGALIFIGKVADPRH